MKIMVTMIMTPTMTTTSSKTNFPGPTLPHGVVNLSTLSAGATKNSLGLPLLWVQHGLFSGLGLTELNTERRTRLAWFNLRQGIIQLNYTLPVSQSVKQISF